MTEELTIIRSANKAEQYQSLLQQVEALIGGETDLVANMANVAAALKDQFKWLWVGFYLVKQGELVLGPFQGPVACTRIAKGKGVCGAAWQLAETLIVPDVDAFPGHIACSSLSHSEIVIPIFKDDHVIGVFDVDSEKLDKFDAIDARYLVQMLKLIKF